jgi:uncharacterized cupredoxin-like copper-binding protein
MARRVAMAVAPMLAMAVLAGCGATANDNDNPSPSVNIPPPGGSGSDQVQTASSKNPTIKLGEYFFKPNAVQTPSGNVNISAPNEGQVPHELVLLKTSTDPAKLKLKNGEVDEGAYQSPGEIADVAPGTTKRATLKLKPGTYAMICNLPGHYKAGMYGSFTVK